MLPRMNPYTRAVAERYDSHFRRPVDQWEDDRLARLLRPHVDGKRVLDLGCGTGWVLDHLDPESYVGVDASGEMLAILLDKHPTAVAWNLCIGSIEWTRFIRTIGPSYDTAVSTWAAHDFPHLPLLLSDLRNRVNVGGRIILHGQGPRYATRPHYVVGPTDEANNWQRFTPERLMQASGGPGLRLEWMRGTGALPDRFAHSRPLWRAALAAPVQWHYAFAACYEVIG